MYPEEVSFNNESEMKTLSEKLKVREITTNKYVNEGISKRQAGNYLMIKCSTHQENIIVILNSHLIKYPQNMCKKVYKSTNRNEQNTALEWEILKLFSQ